MKQIITAEQLDELPNGSYEKYLDWMIEHDYNQGYGRDHIIPMNIGQMIEFLNENTIYQFSLYRRTIDWKIVYEDMQFGKNIGEELCDSLWEAVREKLGEMSKLIKKGKNGKSN